MKSIRYVLSRYWDFLSALLLLVAILISASRLVATDWTDHLSISQNLVFFGVISGLMLGLSRFSSRIAGVFAFCYGLFAIPAQIGLTLPSTYSWSERMVILLNRMQIISIQLIRREPVIDPLLFLVVMFVIFWIISVHAGYSLTRRGDSWLAILPGGIALFIIHSFDSAVADRIWYLAAYLFFALILISRTTFIQRQNRWRQSLTSLPPHMNLDVIRYSVLAAFLVVLFAWITPALAKSVPRANRIWQPVRSAWNDAIYDFENVFISLRATIASYSSVYSPISTLGRGMELSDIEVFYAKAPLGIPIETRLYWQARLFDRYENGQWQSSQESRRPSNPLIGDFDVEPGIDRQQSRFSVLSMANITTLYLPAEPLWVSRAGTLEYILNPDGSKDFVTFSAKPPVGAGEEYEILSSISGATVEMLRAAGVVYPDWIRERYLQLPDTITSRTIALADEITSGLETPYDKAAAITQYLRENISYVPYLEEEPPAGKDPIDWFLFETQTGFCDYYASAQVIMLRALGIPARYAVGFAQGERTVRLTRENGEDLYEASYLVRQRDAHAWPEVYFPKLGWIVFEPTTSQPEIIRGQNRSEQDAGELTEAEELELFRKDRRDQMELLRNMTSQTATPAPSENLIKRFSWIAVLAVGVGLLILSLHYLPLFGLPGAQELLETAYIRAGKEPPPYLKLFILYLKRRPKPKPIQLPALPLLIEGLILHLGFQPPKIIQRWARKSELPSLARAYLEINRALVNTGNPPNITDTPSERAAKLGRLLPPVDTPARELVRQYQIGTFSEGLVNLSLARRSADAIRRLTRKVRIKSFFTLLLKPVRSNQPTNPSPLDKMK